MGGATGNSVGGFAVPKTNPSQLPAKPTGLQQAGGFTQTPTPTGPMHGSPTSPGYGSAGVVPGGTPVGSIGAQPGGMNAGGPGSLSPIKPGSISGSTGGPQNTTMPVGQPGSISGSTGGPQNTTQPYPYPQQPAQREYLSRPMPMPIKPGVGANLNPLGGIPKTTQPMNPGPMNAGGAGSLIPQMKPRDPFAELMALPSVDWNSMNSGG